jgi:hypothetical protein
VAVKNAGQLFQSSDIEVLVGVRLSTGKTNCVFLFDERNAGQIRNVKLADRLLKCSKVHVIGNGTNKP